MSDCKLINIPIVEGEDKKCNEHNSEKYDVNKYQELIRELLYLATRTRLAIAFITSYLSQYNHYSQKTHHVLYKRILRYLNGTKHKQLHFNREFGLLKAYSDANYGNANEGKSFSGGAIFIGNSLVRNK